MVSGPMDYRHLCGTIFLGTSDAKPFITVTEGVPTTRLPAILALALLLSAFGFWSLRRVGD
jgi:hypothetical protein